MNFTDKSILVFGATGQQGGSVARALRSAGWRVKAFVRDPTSDKATALEAVAVELVRGDLTDAQSIKAAMTDAYGVFSVQPSSGQGAAYGVSDRDEIEYGTKIADIAVASGVTHFVYSSANAAGPTLSGVGHFDTKSQVETHIRGLDITSTIIRPSAFMEILTLPGMGLDTGTFSFLMRLDQRMQFIAVEDIGKIVGTVFSNSATFGSRTIEIAGDAATGSEIAAKFSRAANHKIAYQRFPDALLEQNAMLGNLARLVDDGRLAGNADLAALRREFVGLQTFDQWLEGSGKAALESAIATSGIAVSLR